MTDINADLRQWCTNFLVKSPKVVVLICMQINLLLIMKIYLNNYTNQLLENLEKRTVYSWFEDNIWGADLADTQLIIKFNKGFRFLLCYYIFYCCFFFRFFIFRFLFFINIFSKYAWVIPLKDKKGVSIANTFTKVLDKSGRKPNKLWVGKGSKCYNNSIK